VFVGVGVGDGVGVGVYSSIPKSSRYHPGNWLAISSTESNTNLNFTVSPTYPSTGIIHSYHAALLSSEKSRSVQFNPSFFVIYISRTSNPVKFSVFSQLQTLTSPSPEI